MTTHLRDVMRGLTGAEFRSDVQAVHYRTEHNRELLKHYIFTSQAPTGKKSSVELLRTVCEAYAPGALENRFVVIATYGHGKSHFALALANYFGKSHGSEESEVVMAAIRHAIPEHDLGIYGHLESFRQLHQPYLILILRGDEPSDLPTKFHRAIKAALSLEQGEAGASEMPFWFKDAEAFLVNVNAGLRDQANRYLAQYQLDLDSLLAQVRDRQTSAHDVCVGLHMELYKSRPHFEAGLSLAEAVKWLVEDKCGAGKPYSGILILFDEFSAFVENYCYSRLPGTPLQDLLNGVQDARERAAFIAFAQHDPDEAARRSSGGERLSNILKELSRLPTRSRYQLHSSLEEVLESYLRKRDEAWCSFLADNRSFRESLDEASTTALHAFRKRYLDDLRWDTEHFHSLVTVGCYPLHPLTTSLLCSVELQSTTSPRSVLGFVQGEVEDRAKLAVQTTAGPNWVRATPLADYFREMLGEDHWRLYKGAISRLSEPDEPEAATILKAMLLQAIGKASTSGQGQGYVKVISTLSGLSLEATTQLLAQLTERNIIRRDHLTGNYTIAPSGWGEKGEKIAQDKMQQIKIEAATLQRVRTDLRTLGLGPVSIPVQWGHPDDWYADQSLVERGMLTRDYLKGVLRHSLWWTLDAAGHDKARALTIWLLAANEEDVAWYRDHLVESLNDAVGEGAVPLVVMRPTVPSTVLIERLKRYAAIRGFTNQERSEAEHGWYHEAMEQSEKHLKTALASYLKDCIPEAPAAFRARLAALGQRGLEGVLLEVIEMAYPCGHRQWFTQYKLGQARLVEAVSAVCSQLLQKGKADRDQLLAKPPARDLTDIYLRGAWQVLDPADRAVEPSQGGCAFQAWAALDEQFQVGAPSSNPKTVFEKLLNAPFGYDWNTLALLVAAWYAWHRQDLQVTGAWYPATSNAALKPRELLQKASGCAIRRLPDPTGGVEDLVQSVRSGRARQQGDAKSELEALKGFLLRDGVDHALKERVSEAANKLEEALKRAERYDQEARRLLSESERGGLPDALLRLSKVIDLPATSLVKPDQPTADEISATIRQWVERSVEQVCNRHAGLQKLEDFTSNLDQLERAGKLLEKARLTPMIEKIKDAIHALQQARRELDDQRKREFERREMETFVRNVPVRGPISELHSSLAKLEAMEPLPELRQLWDSKRNAINQEISRLASFAHSLDDELDRAASRLAVLYIRDEALRLQNLCDDGEACSLLAAGISRCELVERFLAEVEKIQHWPRSSPADFSRDRDEIRELIAGNANHLSNEHRDTAESMITGLIGALSDAQVRVTERLKRHRAELAEGAPAEKVQRELERADSDWQFLSEDAAASLAQLRQEVQTLVDTAKARREEEARTKAEQGQQERFIQSLPIRGPTSELKRALAALEQTSPQPEVKPLWEKKRESIVTELERLKALPTTLRLAIDRAIDRRSVEACRTTALQASPLYDEQEEQQSVEALVARCDALRQFFEQIEKLRLVPTARARDLEKGIAMIEQIAEGKSEYLSQAQRGVAEKAMAQLEASRLAQQRAALERLASLEQDLKHGQSPSKIQQELEKTDWAFLQTEGTESLQRLRKEVQGRLDDDESQQVELHFRKISDPRQRQKCIEALQRLVEAPA